MLEIIECCEVTAFLNKVEPGTIVKRTMGPEEPDRYYMVIEQTNVARRETMSGVVNMATGKIDLVKYDITVIIPHKSKLTVYK